MTIVEQVVRQYVHLPAKASNKGWLTVICKVCNDYKKRGAFNFSENSVAYKCFNCSAKAYYHDGNGVLTTEMRETLTAFNIPVADINSIIVSNIGKSKNNTTRKIIPTLIKPIELPKHFYRLEHNSDDIWSQIACEYLKIDRGICDKDYTFYLSTDKQWVGRLIIPIYFQNELIYYQGRDLTQSKALKYKNASVKDTTLLIYGYDNIARHEQTPLFIAEGFFDVVQLEGVALLGNILSKEKINYINRSSRQKIYIPDLYGNGKDAAIAAVQAGWSVSFTHTPNCKDVGEAIVKYGKMYVIRELIANAKVDFEALTNINLYCK